MSGSFAARTDADWGAAHPASPPFPPAPSPSPRPRSSSHPTRGEREGRGKRRGGGREGGDVPYSLLELPERHSVATVKVVTGAGLDEDAAELAAAAEHERAFEEGRGEEEAEEVG